MIFDSEAYNNYIEDSGWDEEEEAPVVPEKSLITVKEFEDPSALKSKDVVNTTTDPSMEITRKQHDELARLLDEQREKW